MRPRRLGRLQPEWPTVAESGTNPLHDAPAREVGFPGADNVLLADLCGPLDSNLREIEQRTGLSLPLSALDEAANSTRVAIDKQVSQSSEVLALVQALEQQYDSYSRSQEDPLVESDDQLPSADELGAELERFLAEQIRGDGQQG